MAARPVTANVTLGSVHRIAVQFTDADGTATAPTGSVTFRTVEPDGTDDSTTSGHTNPSTGYYYQDVQLDSVGTWQFRWSANLGAAEAEVAVTSTMP
jgi:hypothetical protein